MIHLIALPIRNVSHLLSYSFLYVSLLVNGDHRKTDNLGYHSAALLASYQNSPNSVLKILDLSFPEGKIGSLALSHNPSVQMLRLVIPMEYHDIKPLNHFLKTCTVP